MKNKIHHLSPKKNIRKFLFKENENDMLVCLYSLNFRNILAI